MSDSDQFDWSALTDRGLVRQKNEDHIALNAQAGIFVLADGMGGHRGGEVASDIGANTVLEHLQNKLPMPVPGEVDESVGYTRESLVAREAVIHANLKIFTTAQQEPKYEGMGTTLVAAIFYLDRLSIAHVGDSRLYRYRQNNLEQLTSDHTMQQELVDRGFYTQQESSAFIQRNLVTRALGVDESVAVDIQEELVLPGDVYILCSDGLYDMVDDQTIARVIRQNSDDLSACTKKLVGLANNNGGKDNISIIAIRSTSETRRPMESPLTRMLNWLRR